MSATPDHVEIAEEARIRPPDKMREMIRLGRAEIDQFFFDQAGRIREDRVAHRERCPVCHGRELSESPNAGNWPLSRCDDCGARFATAVGRADAWADFYAQSKASEIFQREILEATKDHRTITIQQPQADWVKQFFPDGGSLLEVGCAVGAFLEVLEAAGGWAVHGIDPAPEAVRIAHQKGLDKVECCRLEEYETAETFDALCFFGVLLHLDDALGSLRLLTRRLKPNARIFVTEINYAGFDAEIMAEDDPNFAPPRSATLFTTSSIAALLEHAGFVDVEVTTPGRLDVARAYQYWQDGGQNGRHDSFHRLVTNEIETGSSRLQTLIQESKASGHMWATARWPD